jgi:hypothetical protein
MRFLLQILHTENNLDSNAVEIFTNRLRGIKARYY